MELVQARVIERIGGQSGDLEILVGERILVDDDCSSRPEDLDVRDQCRGVHGHQNVAGVARREDVGAPELDLETADAVGGACRSSDFCGIVGKCAQVVAEGRDSIGELGPCQLHPVAGIAGEPDGDLFEGLNVLRHRLSLCLPLDSTQDGGAEVPFGSDRRPARFTVKGERRVRGSYSRTTQTFTTPVTFCGSRTFTL